MKITKQYTVADIETQIEAGVATSIKSASFSDGEEGEVVTTFYKLWGSVVRKVHNKSTTVLDYFFVKGDELDMFISHYGNGG